MIRNSTNKKPKPLENSLDLDLDPQGSIDQIAKGLIAAKIIDQPPVFLTVGSCSFPVVKLAEFCINLLARLQNG